MKLFRELLCLGLARVAAVSVGLALCGCVTDKPSGSPDLTSEPVKPTTNIVASTSPGAPISEAEPIRDVLHVGDTVMVSGITGSEYIKFEEQKENIKEDGTISLHLIGRIKAAGKTAGELQKELQEKYAAYYKRLTIIVRTEGRFYSVGGEVKNPNRFAYQIGLTLLGAIQAAGDFTDYANRTKVQINRANGQKITVNCKKVIQNPQKYDVPIYPGDVIHVPKSIL